MDIETTEKILNLIQQLWDDEEDIEDPILILEFIENKLLNHHTELCNE